MKNTIETTKVCTKCGEDKPFSEYPKRKVSKDGHRNDCKVCHKAAKKAYNEANREKRAAYFKAYYEANREKRKARDKAYHEANREERNAYYKAYREANREKLRAANKAYYAEKWANDPAYRTAATHRTNLRRTRLKGVVQEPYNREAIFERDNWTCQLCQEPIDSELQYPDPGFASIDHIIPISLRGDDTPDNVQAAHLGCNWSKNNRVEIEDQAA